MIDNGRPGHQYPEYDLPTMLTVVTRCPQKWLLVDRETGQTYEGTQMGTWDRLVEKNGSNQEETTDEGI